MAHTLKRISALFFTAIGMVVSTGLFLLYLALDALGAAENSQNIANPEWWQRLFLFLLGIPPWMLFSATCVFAVLFTIQICIDGHSGIMALRQVKNSTEKAWAFEPEFRATIDRFDEMFGEIRALKMDLEKGQKSLEDTIRQQSQSYNLREEDMGRSFNSYMEAVRQPLSDMERKLKERFDNAILENTKTVQRLEDRAFQEIAILERQLDDLRDSTQRSASK